MRDLSRVLLTLWTRDDLLYIPERYRVQTGIPLPLPKPQTSLGGEVVTPVPVRA